MKRPRPNPVDVSTELLSLKHTANQNRKLPKLPSNATIVRRPINHAPVASPFAGKNVQKVVYVSRKTPVISAVKRVKKFLGEIERRAMQASGVDGVLERRGRNEGGDEALQRKLGEVSERLAKDGEEVLVKASGRAMEQALRVGEWFRQKEKEVRAKVEVRCGSVSVVDDVVEREEREDGNENDDLGSDAENEGETTALEGGDTTIELLRNLERDREGEGAAQEQHRAGRGKAGRKQANEFEYQGDDEIPKRQRKRKRREYDPDDLPEARIRWIKTVDVAISLRA